jgi:AcrR family transcriptional regulator
MERGCSASMDVVAARAGVTKRTLYYHFASKDDLIASQQSDLGSEWILPLAALLLTTH